MFDTIYVGTSGLLTHAKGLRVVGDNLANVNTPGFKSAQLQFSDLFEQGSGLYSQKQENHGATGTGVTSLGSRINFSAGLDQTTGNALDLSIQGNGFYAIKRGDELLYTRSGDFRFDADGILVNSAGDHVLGMDASGKLADISLAGYERSAPVATTTVKFSGNLTAPAATAITTDAGTATATVIDASGASHTLNLAFKSSATGSYTVTVTDGTTAVGSGTIKFAAGAPVAGSDSITVSYAPADTTPFDVKLDFSGNVTSLSSSTLLTASQDGYVPGTRKDQSIEADGTVKILYSNGKDAKGPRLVLANFGSEDDLEQVGGSAFRLRGEDGVFYGYAGDGSFGSLLAGHREGSNVDLASEFSNLILMQRGYQASSHVISTANDMIQQLFDMKGNR